MTGRGHASCECHVLRRVEGVGADPIFVACSALLGSCLALVVWALADCFGALRPPGYNLDTSYLVLELARCPGPYFFKQKGPYYLVNSGHLDI
jgi:hypothetical protein